MVALRKLTAEGEKAETVAIVEAMRRTLVFILNVRVE
jgi:hypothetical protein